MPDFGVASIDLVAEKITFEDGRSFTSADLRGNINSQKLNRITAAVQAIHDDRRPLASLAGDDPDKTATQEELDATYGGHMFIDGADIVYRNTLVSFTVVDGALIPHVRRWP